MESFLFFFTDPVLRAPTIGSMLMCLAAGLMGVIVFLRKQSLIGEALSHASYPGVILGVLAAGTLSVDEISDWQLPLLILIGAFSTALLGILTIGLLTKRFKVPSDAALCFVLSTFFGVGLTLASEVQFSYTRLYKQVLTYLYGQAATMTDIHIWIYGTLAAIVLLTIALLYKELQTITFDKDYAKSLGINIKAIDFLILILVVLSVIIGIRSVGVVLMSAMLIAPAVAARQFTNRLSVLFVLAAFFSLMSGFLGNYLSVQIAQAFKHADIPFRINLPTGPMIVLVASGFALLALLFAPQRGLIIRFGRILLFRYNCICENILKAIWRWDHPNGASFQEIRKFQEVSALYLFIILFRMKQCGWIYKTKANNFALTQDGKYRAEKIVRLHRLWEVYLVNYLGVGAEKVHKNAEEMEHIITPELERELTRLLKDPKQDPHEQPIPPAFPYALH